MGEVHTIMHPLKGKKQRRKHVLNRIAANPAMQPIPLNIRFERMTDRSGECWLWKGKEFTWGHGRARIEIRGQRITVYRAAYEYFIGPIPAGLGVLHHCDEPLCIRPDHLFLGTNADNYHDSQRKNRHCAGERHGMAKLTAEDVHRIRASHLSKPILAAIFGVHPGHIKSIRSRRVWDGA